MVINSCSKFIYPNVIWATPTVCSCGIFIGQELRHRPRDSGSSYGCTFKSLMPQMKAAMFPSCCDSPWVDMAAPVGFCYLSWKFSELFWELEVCKGKPLQQVSKGSAAKSVNRRQIEREYVSCRVEFGSHAKLVVQCYCYSSKRPEQRWAPKMLWVAEIYELPSRFTSEILTARARSQKVW